MRTIAMFALLAAPLLSQQSLRVEVSGRPVAEALDQFERMSGIPVHYEDVRYDHPDDVEDVSDRVWNPDNQTPVEQRRRVIVPKSRSLSFTVGIGDDGRLGDTPALERAAASLIAAAAAADLPGRFELARYERSGKADLFILPSAMRARDGVQRPSFAVLGTPISVSINAMSGVEALKLVLKRVSEVSGKTIKMGMLPFGPLAWTKVSLDADRQPAGHVLAELLSQLQGLHSIRMLYAPDMKYYAFNMRPVRPPGWTPTPTPPSGGDAPTTTTQRSGSPWQRPAQR